MSAFRIAGIGTAVPGHSIEQPEAALFASTCLAGEADAKRATAVVEALYRRSGVKTRHSVVLDSSSSDLPATQSFYGPSDEQRDRGPGTSARMQKFEQDAPALAALASSEALATAGVDAADVSHLITVSCSGFSAPGFDLSLIDRLGLRSTVARTHVGFMGCHGALNALRVARAFSMADPKAVVLICALELCSLHHQYGWDPQRIVANSLFADGAAAIVGGCQRFEDSEFDLQLTGNASRILPDTADMMTWRIGDHGFQMTLSPEVPGVITRMLPAAVEEFLASYGLQSGQIPSWAIHPGGPRILSACADSLQLTEQQLDPSVSILGRFGNMSSPTVVFILKELLHRRAEFPCLMLGFGPGLNVEMALIDSP